MEVKLTRIRKLLEDLISPDPSSSFSLSKALRCEEDELDNTIMECMPRFDDILSWRLSEGELLVINLRYGLISEKPYSVREIAQTVGLSNQRIYQILHRAQRKLRHQITWKALRKEYSWYKQPEHGDKRPFFDRCGSPLGSKTEVRCTYKALCYLDDVPLCHMHWQIWTKAMKRGYIRFGTRLFRGDSNEILQLLMDFYRSFLDGKQKGE